MSHPLVVHNKKAPFDVYIGRPSKWGNPFSHLDTSAARFEAGSRDEAIDKYCHYLMGSSELLADLHELKGKTLGCWCAPKPCHGDVLAELANK